MKRTTDVPFDLSHLSDRILESMIRANLEGDRINRQIVELLVKTLMREKRRRLDGSKAAVKFSIPFLSPEENNEAQQKFMESALAFLYWPKFREQFTPLELTVAAFFCTRIVHTLEAQQAAMEHATTGPVN